MLSRNDDVEWETEEPRHAGFWLRLAAFSIDVIFILFCLFFTRIIPDGAMIFTARLFPNVSLHDYLFNLRVTEILTILLTFWLYFSLMECSRNQATVGKAIIGIKVTDVEGERLSFGKATGKFFAQLASLCLLGIGHLFALFTEKRETFYDKITGCTVIKK